MRIIDTIHHMTIREINKTHGDALHAIAMNMVQIGVLVGGFYAMNVIMHQGSAPLRGDLLIYILSGVFLFQVHVQAVSSGMRAEMPSSPIMAHAGLNSMIGLISAGLASLYQQMVSVAIIAGAYDIFYHPVLIDQPVRLAGLFLLAWASGLFVGMILFALRTHSPSLASVASQAYSRVNLLASGQMFIASTLPAYMLKWFTWNPLFHIIDQARDAAFINYRSWFTTTSYPVYFCIAMLGVGTIAEWWARRSSSLSDMARL